MFTTQLFPIMGVLYQCFLSLVSVPVYLRCVVVPAVAMRVPGPA